jgi:hypothetical protein
MHGQDGESGAYIKLVTYSTEGKHRIANPTYASQHERRSLKSKLFNGGGVSATATGRVNTTARAVARAPIHHAAEVNRA